MELDHGTKRRLLRLSRAAILVVAAGAYLASAFKFTTTFWTNGLGDWADPYFINYLLEHWQRSVSGFTNPASPPMFYPATGTLGYSHGLILYVPFYVAFRLLFHPFQAHNLTIITVLFIGILSLYVLLRRLQLSFVESFLLAAVFLTSPNVTDGSLGVWSQRASVFLIPTLFLITLLALHTTGTRARLPLVGAAGLAASLLYAQDFHTAHFSLLLIILALVPLIPIGYRWISEQAVHGLSARRSSIARLAALIAASATAWAVIVLVFGGFSAELFGLTVRSHDWRRPALLGAAGGAIWLWQGGGRAGKALVTHIRPEVVAFGTGALLGGLVFGWIYGGAYLEHRAFPEAQLVDAAVTSRSLNADSVASLLRGFSAYQSPGSFLIPLVLVLLALVPGSGATRTIRIYALWGLTISIAVLLISVRLGDFSLWMSVVAPLPGFAAIRDPTRIIYVYELAVVFGAALFMSRFARGAPVRLAVSVTLLLVLVSQRHWASFDFLRPIEVYERWVASPITVDERCSSFYIKPASSVYGNRPNTVWTTYALDAMFVSLNHSIPTLNGYSAWGPSGWTLGNPTDETYPAAVRQWIERHQLRNVCELDIEQRTITTPDD